jgi:hypothetical protein
MPSFPLLPVQLPLAVACSLLSVSLTLAEPAIPGTLLFESEHLAAVRASKFSQDAEISRALNELRKRADQALKHEPQSVTYQSELAASGDPHDYVSFATYWWPNPDTADGLPYVRRDGHANEKLISQGDRELLNQMHADVMSLALAGYLLDEPRYSERATKLLRVFFLDAKTRMNPNLRHAQLIRGVNTGRSFGIIDTEVLVWTLEGVRILESSDSLDATELAGLRHWFTDYLNWLRHDPFCAPEQRARNNHGTFYDFQVAGFALFLGDHALAKQVLEGAKQTRIAVQVEPDGRQPLEIERTNGFGYSCGNLHGLCTLARLGDACDVDLWHYESPRGGSIVKAYSFLLPYLTTEMRWPWQQQSPMSPTRWLEPESSPCYWLNQRFPGRNYLAPATLAAQQGKHINLACLVYVKRGRSL